MYPGRSILFIRLTACLKKMFMLVLLFRRKSAADMALRLVDIKNDPSPSCKIRIDMEQTIGNVLVHRTFTDSKPFRRLSHRRILINNIVRDLNRPLFNIFLPRGCPSMIFLPSYYKR